ncbi:MAG: hypothetical protein EBS38_01375 [Actinobacteria bacterium]|nr:hypothetical protein [Actinomycetota bacterium]
MPAYGLIPDSPLITGASKLYKNAAKKLRGKGLNLKPRNMKVSMQFGRLVVYKPILDFELNHRYGTVGRHLHRTANQISQLAKLQVGKKTGRLRNSIRFQHLPKNGMGPGIKVGAYTHYARLHHDGTRPHLIVPNKPGGTLVFTKGARVIQTKVVRHPGTRPNRYLTDPMRTVIRGQRRSLRG